MSVPRIMICAGASGSGKTLITCGILQALINRGLKVVSFKCGPDYIDPMFHTKVIGTRSRNLDTFFAEPKVMRHLMEKNSEGMDIAVIEGVMGYYDGLGGISDKGSAYDVARQTSTPAVLVVDCKGMSLSIAAYVEGFLNFRSDSNIKGVILNRISPVVYDNVKKTIEAETGVRVAGYVPEVTDCRIESRHLGLIMPDEIADLKDRLCHLAEILEDTLDFSVLMELAESAGPSGEVMSEEEAEAGRYTFRLKKPVRIALARDEAFCFMYEDNLDLLRSMGAEIVEFSPIHDSKLPDDADGLILYGGYPELHAEELTGNTAMKEDILRRCRDGGLPLLAECGGFMYLHESMEDNEGRPYPGVGLIKGRAYKTKKLGRFGYITLSMREDRADAAGEAAADTDGYEDISGGTFPCHEFHYFDSTNPGEAFLAQKPLSERKWNCIHFTPSMAAGFPHFYYYGNPKFAVMFLKRCASYRDRRNIKH